MKPYYQDDLVTLYHGDCREFLPPYGGALVSDPPYPNTAGHFLDGIARARDVIKDDRWALALLFWDEMEVPPSPLPLVARHVWHRTNTNRPDNYEAIYVFNPDGRKRPSHVFPAAVVYPGLTGCKEATGHPTQKPSDLMQSLIRYSVPIGHLIVDPFAGSGSTLVACKNLRRPAVGVEINERYCDDIARRLSQQVLPLEAA